MKHFGLISNLGRIKLNLYQAYCPPETPQLDSIIKLVVSEQIICFMSVDPFLICLLRCIFTFSMIIYTYHECMYLCVSVCVCAIWENIAWVSFGMVFMELDDCQLDRRLNYTSAKQNTLWTNICSFFYSINVFNWNLKSITFPQKHLIICKIPWESMHLFDFLYTVHRHIESGKVVWHRTQRFELRMMATVSRYEKHFQFFFFSNYCQYNEAIMEFFVNYTVHTHH